MFYLHEEKTKERRLFDDREIESLGDFNPDRDTEHDGSFNVILKTGTVFHAYGNIQDYDMVLKGIVKGFNLR